ncbi:winged helix-turn-helix domain-containing protein [Rhizobium sp.]|uniref:ATP-binding protein n=1 Tax=Rhizobium sp. TaxID=391 RepID=UPI002899E390
MPITKEVCFGPYKLVPAQRLLLEDNKPVAVGSRALDILLLLVSRPNAIVSKAEIMAAVWPETFVVEANLTVHVAALRRALGDGKDDRRFIVNVPGRGYRFTGVLSYPDFADEQRPTSSMTAPPSLPLPLTRLIGRSDALEHIGARVRSARLVTILGSAGIGKTSCALAFAHSAAPDYPDGVWFVDLSRISDGDLIATAIATSLRLAIGREVDLSSIIEQLDGRRLLIVIDNCEHLVEAVSDTVVTLLKSLSELRIVCTSREALRVEGEHIYRLGALALPPDGTSTLETTKSYPATALFMERAEAVLDTPSLTDVDAGLIARICADLEGIPLAIEFAAARVDTFTLSGLRTLIGEQMRLAGGERRGTVARHRTILNALDWSYDLLTADQQKTLRALAVFAGGFTPEDVAGVTAQAVADVQETLADLVLKSLVVVDADADGSRFRLLDIIRSYGRTKLEAADEWRSLRLAHARHFALALAAAKRDLGGEVFLSRFSPEIDNVRAAFATVVAVPNQADIALQLAASAAPLFFGMSLMAECRRSMTSVMALQDPAATPTSDMLDVQSALAAASYFTLGLTDETLSTWQKTLDYAETMQDVSHMLSALVALWTFQIREPNYEAATMLAERHAVLAAAHSDPDAPVMADWILGTTRHHIGDLPAAQHHFERFLENETEAQRLAFVLRTGFDRRSASRAILANALWMQGHTARGLELGEIAIVEARQLGKALPLCEALIWQGVTLHLAGLHERALVIAEELLEHASAYFLDSHLGFGHALRGLSLDRAGAYDEARQELTEGLTRLSAARYRVFHPLLMADLARMTDDGKLADAALEEPSGWCSSEGLLRKAELLSSIGDPATRASFDEGLDMARSQNNVFWELRLGLSLGRSKISRGKPLLALAAWRDCVSRHPSVRQFAEGVEIEAELRKHDNLPGDRATIRRV